MAIIGGQRFTRMHRSLPELFVCACLAACVVVPVGAQPNEVEQPVEIAGQCEYANRLAPLIDQRHTFAICDRLKMRRSEAGIELEFSYPSRLQSIGFAGSFEQQDQVKVTAIRLRGQGEWSEADGTCSFEPPGAAFLVVTCIVKSGTRFFVANFEPDR